MNGRTGKTIPFDRIDDGADIVETSYLLMGFLCAREYFNTDKSNRGLSQKADYQYVECCKLELAHQQ